MRNLTEAHRRFKGTQQVLTPVCARETRDSRAERRIRVNSDGKELETNMQRKKERKKERKLSISQQQQHPNSSPPSRRHWPNNAAAANGMDDLSSSNIMKPQKTKFTCNDNNTMNYRARKSYWEDRQKDRQQINLCGSADYKNTR